MEYRVIWVSEFIVSSNGTQELPATTGVLNEWADAGWRVHSVVPGTNAQTYGGLFVTLHRD